MVFVSTFTSEKNQLQFMKKWNVFEFYVHPFICPIIPERKKVNVIFTFKHSLLNPRTNYETMDSVFILGPDIQDTDIQAQVKKNWEIFFMKIKYFSRKTKASYLMTKTWLVQKNPTSLLFVLSKNGFCIFRQCWEIWATNEEKIFEYFSSLFLPKMRSWKKLWRHFF